MKKRMIAWIAAVCLLLSSASALTVEQAGELLKEYYIEEVPQQVLAQPTIEQMLEALGDPYAAYYSAEEYEDFLAGMEDTRLVGIGINIYFLDEGLLIDLIAPDSPAAEAGLQVGDYLIMVDGKDVRGADYEQAAGWMQGEEGSTVELTVLRGEQTFVVTAVRREVVFPTVVLKEIEDGLGWISCSTFGSDTFREFYEILAAYDDRVNEWVVDLRGNPGGDLYATVFSAGLFAGKDVEVYLRGGDGEYTVCRYDPDLIAEYGLYEGTPDGLYASGAATGNPVHVLVDETTASAAELFAAIVRNTGIGLVVGARTYGKGVAQSVFAQDTAPEGLESYFTDGDGIKFTTDRVFSMSGATNDKIGVLPNLVVDPDMADEVIAFLAAPITAQDELLQFGKLASGSKDGFTTAVPVHLLQDPQQADTVEHLLSALPETANCTLLQGIRRTPLTLEETALLAGVSLNRVTFSDLEGYVYRDAINTLGLYGMVNGVGNGSFCPHEGLTRAQVCALLGKAMRFPQSGESEIFADVPEDAWYAPYVNALYATGLVKGYDDGLFHPEDIITHEQFLVLLGRTARWLDMDYYEMSDPEGIYGDLLPTQEVLEERFGDYSPWARELVWLCSGDLCWTDPEQMDAQEVTTRGEAAAGMYNLLRMSGVIPG